MKGGRSAQAAASLPSRRRVRSPWRRPAALELPWRRGSSVSFFLGWKIAAPTLNANVATFLQTGGVGTWRAGGRQNRSPSPTCHLKHTHAASLIHWSRAATLGEVPSLRPFLLFARARPHTRARTENIGSRTAARHTFLMKDSAINGQQLLFGKRPSSTKPPDVTMNS